MSHELITRHELISKESKVVFKVCVSEVFIANQTHDRINGWLTSLVEDDVIHRGVYSIEEARTIYNDLTLKGWW